MGRGNAPSASGEAEDAGPQLSRRALVLASGAAAVAMPARAVARAEEDLPYRHRFKSRLVDLGDTRLEVLEAGSGRTTFVCSHPYADASGPFPGGGLTEALASVGRTIYVCPRGTAGSAAEARRDKLTLSQLADDMEQVRRKLDIGQWVPVGTSTGGMTALQYGVRYPDVIRGLVLVCTAASYRFLESPDSIYNSANPLNRNLERLRIATSSGEEWRRAQLAASVYNKSVLPLVERTKRISVVRADVDREEVGVNKWDVEPMLKAVRAPTLIVAGRFDAQAGSLIPSFTMAREIVNSELAIMNRSGHMPYEEEASRFKAVVADFTRRLDSAT